jgi:hypothetical protein
MAKFCETCPAVAHLMVLDGVSLAEVLALRSEVDKLRSERDGLQTKVAARDRLIAQKNNELNQMRARSGR